MTRPLFRPPFDIRAGLYHGITYHGHSPYSVDFNRGAGSADAGDWVLSSLDGDVRSVDPAYGAVKIAHPAGWETWYYHLARVNVVVGQHVRQGEHIGSIGRTYPGATVLSPHLHVNQLLNGTAVQVWYDGAPYPASLSAPAGIVVGPSILGQCPYDPGVAAR